MQLPERFSDADLEKIVDDGLIYMCACPAQVAVATRKVREMYRYQLNCLQDQKNDSRVHATIAKTAEAVHAQLEECMEEILAIEQWDRQTLTMPAHLRKRQLVELGADSKAADLSGQ